MKRHLLSFALATLSIAAWAGSNYTIVSEHATPSGNRFSIARDDAGRIIKLHTDPRQAARDEAPAPAVKAPQSPRDTTFYEGFEDYEEYLGLNWIPPMWTEINTEANAPTPTQLMHNINNSWYCYYSSNMYQDYTTDGDKEAFIHYAYDGDYGTTDAAQDEWLVTPEIQLARQETLHFLLQYDCSEIYNFDYFDYGTYEYSKRELFCNFYVMITTDGGENWDTIFDLEHEYVSPLSDYAIMKGTGIYLHEFEASLRDYDGKNVKLAFRYTRNEGWGGNSMILDGVVIDHPHSAGIEDITPDGDNGNAVYYNLQGMRVEQPAPGAVYIRRDATGSHKVFVK
ncbi:MAG: choice-of-anchor J domain-containing protein [Muribaculaceae bacterium]|nr:choice-of-anchor J domain-containing protein [Muribaculaceae bacterium]